MHGIVTPEYIRQAALWAQTARDQPMPVDGHTRRYSQGSWDCGTACCIWGAAWLLAGNAPTDKGPSREWADQSDLHTDLCSYLGYVGTTPEDVLECLADYGITAPVPA